MIEKIERIGRFSFYGLSAVLAAYVFLKYAAPIILPFAAAYVISYGVRRLSGYLCGKTGIAEMFWSGVIIVASVGIIFTAVWFGFAALFREARNVLMEVADSIGRDGGIADRISEFVSGVAMRFGIDDVSGKLSEWMSSAAASLTSAAAGASASAASGAPMILIGIIFASIVFFYFVFGKMHLSDALSKVAGGRYRRTAEKVLESAADALGKLIRVYGILLMVNFAILSVGFLIMGSDNAFVFAFFCALFDLLPVIGVGTFLVPYAVYLFICADYVRAIGALAILGGVSITRQTLEAKLLGKNAGVHPTLEILLVYAGLRLAGVAGMILLPAAVNITLTAVNTRRNG